MDDRPGTIHAFLAAERARQQAFLAALVRAPSDNPSGDCAAHAEHAACLLEGVGLTVERHPVPAERVAAQGMISVTNLVVRHRFGEGGPMIALNAHGDVVPPGEGWTHDPYGAAVEDGWMYGRGVAVSKSDFATYAWALLALQACAAQDGKAVLRGAVELHLTYDEETGGEIGPALLLRSGISRPDFAIGAGFSYGVVNAHNGCLHLEVRIDGRSAHAAMPATGVDALEAAHAVLSALYQSRSRLAGRHSEIAGIGQPQLTVGTISGGINTNVVPDRVTLRLDRRIIPEEDPAEVEAALRAEIAASLTGFPAARLTIRRTLLAGPLRPMPGASALTDALCRHASTIMGEAVGAHGVPLYTDARHYAEAGVPVALFGAGPRSIEEANAHRADERLFLSDLPKASEVIACTILELLERNDLGLADAIATNLSQI